MQLTTFEDIRKQQEWNENYFTNGDSKLELKESGTDGIKVGIKKNGQKYSVRDDRRRFFFPDEWHSFWMNLETTKQGITADMLMNTGARISEANNTLTGILIITRYVGLPALVVARTVRPLFEIRDR